MKSRAASLILLSLVAACAASAESNWPRFRGADGSGVCAKFEAALTTQAIAWKTPVPAAGFSSPIVWDNRVFLSGGDETKREVICFDADSGKLLWEKGVPAEAGAEIPEQCGAAAATMATDGQRVFAIFTGGELAAFDFEGKLVWSKKLGVPKNPYGHAASLAMWHERLIVQLDQATPDDELSALYAFNAADGSVAWKTARPVGASWSTPIVIEPPGKAQIVTLAVPFVISYAPESGREIWRADCLDGEVTPSPVFAAGTLFVVNPSNKLQAIRPDGEKDVTASHLGWSAEDGIPDVTSPVTNGELIFVVDAAGMLSCYDAKEGAKQWQHDLGEACHASPSIAGQQLVLITKSGVVITCAVAREFREIGRLALGEEVFASPAFAHERMYVRGVKTLMCVGAK